MSQGYTDPDGCDFSQFFNESDPRLQQLAGAIYSSCTPFAPCRPECRTLADRLWADPCLQGSSFDIIKQAYMQSTEGTGVCVCV